MLTDVKTIQVFGSGCPTCKTLYERTVSAVGEMNLSVDIEYVTDIQRIIDLGLMQSPVLVVDGDPIVVGHVPDVKSIGEAIATKLSR